MSLHRRVGVSALLVLLAAGLVALSPIPSSQSNIAVTTDNAPAEAGMMAYIDPETGTLTMGHTPAGEIELDEDTQNALRRDDEGLEVVQHADGSVSVDLQGRFQHVSIVRIDENGKMTVCADNTTSAEHSLTKPVTHPSTPEVK